MNIIKTNSIGDFDFLNKKRNVYFAGGETQAKTEVQNEGEKKSRETAVKPMEVQDWNSHEQRVGKNLAALEKVAPKVAEKAKKNTGTKLAELKTDYDKDINKAKKERDKAAANSAPAIDKLIKDKKGEAEQSAQKPAEADKGTKLEGTDLNKAVDLIIKQAESEMRQAESQGSQFSQNLKGILSNPEAKVHLTEIVAQLPFSSEQIRELQSGKLTLSKEQLSAVMGAPVIPIDKENKTNKPKDYGEVNDQEIALVRALNLGGKNCEDIFGKESCIPDLLSRKYVIEQSEDGNGIKIDGKNVKDIKELKPFIIDRDGKTDEELGKRFDDLINNTDNSKRAQILRNFNQLAEGQNNGVVDEVAKNEKIEEKKENEKGKLTDPKQIEFAANTICSKLGVTDKEWMVRIEKKVAEMKFTEAKRKDIKDKTFEPDDDQLKQIAKETSPKINEYDPKKGAALGKSVEKMLGEIKIGKQAKEAIRNMFDTDAKPLRRSLVMSCNIEEMKDGIKINGKDIKSLKDMSDFMPANVKDNFTKLIDFKDNGKAEDLTKLQSDIWNSSTENGTRLENLKNIQNALLKQLDPESAQDKSKSRVSWIMTIIKLVQAAQKAFKYQDWNSLNDFVGNLKNPEEMEKSLNASKEAYKKTVDDPKFNPNVKDLFSAIKDIRGTEANKLFLANVPIAEKEQSPLNKYRYEATDALTDYAKNALGLSKIEEINKISGDRMEIKAERDGVPMTVELNFAQGKNEARVIKHIKSGDNWVKPTSEGIAYQSMENGIAGLKNIIDGGGTKNENAEPQPNTVPATNGETAPATQPKENEKGGDKKEPTKTEVKAKTGKK